MKYEPLFHIESRINEDIYLKLIKFIKNYKFLRFTERGRGYKGSIVLYSGSKVGIQKHLVEFDGIMLVLSKHSLRQCNSVSTVG